MRCSPPPTSRPSGESQAMVAAGEDVRLSRVNVTVRACVQVCVSAGADLPPRRHR